MTHKVGPKGQVVLPKHMRDALGLQPGDEVDFEMEDNAIRVEPVRRYAGLRGSLASKDLVAELERDRRAEPR